ncbi:hypothetical protein GGR57DRAFT_61732 [Xylariaceae sp. FL1272]|nr:hypothetical protein GGR57DRAFT_61732 [Xylariaceae sp. FL1272]
MDPFNDLPPELQLEILSQLDSPEDCAALVRASPVMWRQARYSHYKLDKVFLCRDFSPRLLQIATAVVHFPKRDTAWRRHEQVDEYLELWAAGSLPDPFAKKNQDILAQVIQLYRRIRILAQDYIAKATSKPQTYPYRLPNLETEAMTGVFDMRDLRPMEKERLFNAFLRYELLCKIYQPESNEYEFRRHAHHPKGFLYFLAEWDWQVLDIYEECESAPWDIEALVCIHEYIGSLYTAMVPSYMSTYACEPPVCAGKCSSWLECAIPDPESAPSDNVQSSSAIESVHNCGHLRMYDMSFYRPSAITALAASGLTRLCKSLAGLQEGKKLNFKTLAEKRYNILPRHIAEIDADLVVYSRSENDEGPHEPNAWRVHHSELPHEVESTNAATRLRLGIYRQRAWVFFDDDRFHANSCYGRLPSHEDMKQAQTRSYKTEIKGQKVRGIQSADCYCLPDDRTETFFSEADIKKLRLCFWSIPPESRFFE